MRSLIILVVIQIAVGVFIPHNITPQPGFVSLSPPPFQQWQRYKIEGEEFSVSLPALPAMNTRNTLIAPRKERITRVLGSYGDGVAYAINTYENLQGQTLDDFAERTRQRRSRIREWTDRTDVTIDGFTGLQYSITERGVSGLVQFFRTKDHLYHFEAMGAPITDPRIQMFFTSLKLGKKLEGTEVRDGIGAQPDAPSAPVLPSKDLDQKVVVLTKPEPSYTEPARQARTVGAVVLKVVFAGNGGISDVEVVAGLPNGLTEQALKVVKQIRFVPGVKNGQYVSTPMQLEYNFNLY
jgi:TonB family protein